MATRPCPHPNVLCHYPIACSGDFHRGNRTFYILFNNIVMGNGDIAVNKTGKNLCFHGTCVLKTRTDIRSQPASHMAYYKERSTLEEEGRSARVPFQTQSSGKAPTEGDRSQGCERSLWLSKDGTQQETAGMQRP